ncbi:MAG: tRNA epoxyqueuosine(34) reductase QueG [Planctomycetes bacterium]|nr:tRNA epoxyqueuosine(34) reductase QueG [Planctomycetota bacterium]
MSASNPSTDRRERTLAVKAAARELGFDLVGIAPAVSPPGFPRFQEWLRAGFAGEMQYLPRREAAYEHPCHVSQSVHSIVMLAINYRTDEPVPSGPNTGRVARYAWGAADYHDLLRDKLRQLSDILHERHPGCTTRGVVDTAPLLERDFARLAGLGWFGKNTMLIHKRAGSWLLLAALLTDLDLEPDAPHATSHCGTCTRCLDVCPTQAFTGPCVLDARKCISYLTIELKGQIPLELRDGVGEWLFGCDLCQDVCPWNHKAPGSSEPAFQPHFDLHPADCISILRMSREEFQRRFAKTPLERPGFDGIRRNAAIVLGNQGDALAVPPLIEALQDNSSLVRGAAAWALGKLSVTWAQSALQARLQTETDSDVREEILRSLPKGG